MTDQAAYAAGYAQGSADVQNRVSSPAPANYENSPDYASGYADGFAQSSDPQSYAEGREQGRSDTVHKVSSMPPAYADENHYDSPGGPKDSYNKGYAEGAAAPPYLSDLEAQEKAERDARERSRRNMNAAVGADAARHDRSPSGRRRPGCTRSARPRRKRASATPRRRKPGSATWSSTRIGRTSSSGPRPRT